MQSGPYSHHEQNRRSWNAATPVHNAHKRDQAKFLRDGGSTLFDEELELVGNELAGKRLLHLQCNSGQDSLSLAALGASVTGVDIADTAIEFARTLSTDSGIAATFERQDILTWLPRASADGRRFDVVFSTYGTIGWIQDLAAWARGVAGVLAPGGALVLLEFHPMVWVFDQDFRIIDTYFGNGAIQEADGVSDYVGASDGALVPSGKDEAAAREHAGWKNPEASVAFQWTVADTVQAVIDAGLVVEVLREYPYSNGARIWSSQPRLDDRRFACPPGKSLPMMLGLRARKP